MLTVFFPHIQRVLKRDLQGFPMKYKGILLATAGSVVGMSGAQAADLPMKAAPMYTPAPATWTGFYAGIHLGGTWQHAKADYADPADGTLGKAYGGGIIGGGQIGYNWQMGNTVWGLEATISGLTGKATADPVDNAGKGHSIESRIDWLATFRGRAGWLMNPDTLLYATGGLAVGGVKNSADPNGPFNQFTDPLSTHKSVNKTKTGWVVGAGMEHMLSRNWTIGLEALYVDLGKTTSFIPDSGKATTFKNTAVIGQLKVNYKF
jgi:outer membrane immunogenic protein